MPSRSNQPPDRRQHLRIKPRMQLAVTCFLQEDHETSASPNNMARSLADFSVKGVSLLVSDSLNKGDRLTVVVEPTAGVTPVLANGTVIWSREILGEYWVGIEFDEPLAVHTWRLV